MLHGLNTILCLHLACLPLTFSINSSSSSAPLLVEESSGKASRRTIRRKGLCLARKWGWVRHLLQILNDEAVPTCCISPLLTELSIWRRRRSSVPEIKVFGWK